MRFVCFAILGLLGFIHANAQSSSDLSVWTEVKLPSEDQPDARRQWWISANNSEQTYRVSLSHGHAMAALLTATSLPESPHLPFSPKPGPGPFHGTVVAQRVIDGWLISFEEGENGGALYWFGLDGKSNYKISGHQIVAFVPRGDQVYAIEGLAHIVISEGSVIHIDRDVSTGRWKTETLRTLPQAPFTVTSESDGNMLIALSDSLVRVTLKGELETLLDNMPWDGLYPNSSVLSAHGDRLYIGMRAYVADVDLITRKFRFLAPPPPN